MTEIECTDLELLPGEVAMEEIHDMTEDGTPRRFGALVMSKIIRIGADSVNGKVIISALLETGQAATISFGYHDSPVIEPTIQVIGANRSTLVEDN